MNEPITETDYDAVALLHELLARLGDAVSLYDRIHAAKAGANSVIAADSLATNPFQIGHFAGYCLLQAVDTCRSITRVVRDEDGGLC